MNTRLQVEHPVTEMITGKDLVKEQVRIARGEALTFGQEDLKIDGHAIELRVYAEDPEGGFLPDTGRLEVYEIPQGPGVRVDDGFKEGMDIPVFYDPMISKLCVHAPTREEAMDRMIRAIDEYQVVGVKTTLGFGKFVMEHEAFRSGDFDTGFVKNHYETRELRSLWDEDERIAAAVVASILHGEKKPQVQAMADQAKPVSNWRSRRILGH